MTTVQQVTLCLPRREVLFFSCVFVVCCVGTHARSQALEMTFYILKHESFYGIFFFRLSRIPKDTNKAGYTLPFKLHICISKFQAQELKVARPSNRSRGNLKGFGLRLWGHIAHQIQLKLVTAFAFLLAAAHSHVSAHHK